MEHPLLIDEAAGDSMLAELMAQFQKPIDRLQPSFFGYIGQFLALNLFQQGTCLAPPARPLSTLFQFFSSH
jgi:hypothetical protein